MNNKIINHSHKIPIANKHQRSSSIPTRKNIVSNSNVMLKGNRENSRERSRPASKNLRDLNNERLEQADKLEEDIAKLEKENCLMLKRNNDFELFLDKLKFKLEKLNLNYKDTKDNIHNAQRLKTNLINKRNKIKKDIENSHREFEMFKMFKEYKINTVNNNIQYAKNIKEDRKNSFAKKIEIELHNQKKIEKDFKETKNKINKMKKYLSDIDAKRNKSADKIFKEKHEMERFLINI